MIIVWENKGLQINFIIVLSLPGSIPPYRNDLVPILNWVLGNVNGNSQLAETVCQQTKKFIEEGGVVVICKYIYTINLLGSVFVFSALGKQGQTAFSLPILMTSQQRYRIIHLIGLSYTQKYIKMYFVNRIYET